MNRREFLRQLIGVVSITPLLAMPISQRPKLKHTVPMSDMIIFEDMIRDVVLRAKKVEWITIGRPEVVDYYKVILNSFEV